MSATRIFATSLPSRRDAGLGLLAVPAAGVILATRGAASDDSYRALPGDGAWINSAPIRPADLRGKVVLVNFWTYTCINSLRPLPYLRTWADRYRDRGLIVLGVHAPEFSFEHELPRVRHAVAELGVRYPVVLDNDFRIWRSFQNEVWPGFYVLDAQGRVCHQKLGEGDYDKTEGVIKALLGEVAAAPDVDVVQPVTGEGSQAAPDWPNLESPETYLGYAKATAFVGVGLRRDVSSIYKALVVLPRNSWSLSSAWNARSGFVELTGHTGAISIRFHARDLHLVMGPGPDDRPVRFRVRIDNVEPGENHGVDVDAAGWGELRDARMYQLIRQAGSVRDRTFEVEFESAGVRAYCFTFG